MKKIVIPASDPSTGVSIALSGPIAGCDNWQDEVADYLKNEKVTVFSNRPEHTVTANPTVAKNHFKWEQSKLLQADALCFYFPMGGIWVESVLNLGMALELAKPMFIFMDKNYAYSARIIQHISSRREHQTVNSDVPSLISELRIWIRKYQEEM